MKKKKKPTKRTKNPPQSYWGRGASNIELFGLTFWKLISVEVFYVDIHPAGVLLMPLDKCNNNDNTQASESWIFSLPSFYH